MFEENASIPPWTCPFIKSTPWVALARMYHFSINVKVALYCPYLKTVWVPIANIRCFGCYQKKLCGLSVLYKNFRICCHACQLSRLVQSSSFEYYGIFRVLRLCDILGYHICRFNKHLGKRSCNKHHQCTQLINENYLLKFPR